MRYLYIVVTSYLLTFIALLIWARTKNSKAEQRLKEIGATKEQLANFRREALPPHLLARPTVFFGTLVGALMSASYWIVAK